MFAFSLPRLPLAAVLSLAFTLAPTADLRAATITLPDNAKIEKVDFEQHVMGLFVRLGCSSGSCHGSFQGKGGLRLSLFGYDPSLDYAAVTRESLGRRINPADPDTSLLLVKGAGLTDHGGGRRFSPGSWQWNVLREWIASGATWQKGSGDVASLTITPAEHAYRKSGETQPLTVIAKFADGREVNVTPFADYRTNNEAVAEVDTLGRVKALQPGDAAIIVSYRGTVNPVRVLVPMPTEPGFKYPAVAEVNFIDREVFAKLRRLNIIPSDLSGDAEFLLRVTLDTIGSLPSPEDVRAFLADKSPDKRAKKIDELLAHPLHAALWATKFSDITGNNTDLLENPQQLKPKRSQMWHDWFRKRVHENMPYDEIVRGVLTATSRDGKPVEEWIQEVKDNEEALGKGFENKYAERASLDLFWRRQMNVPIEQWGEKTAAAFMGIRLECAQCHKHPMDRWTQADYRSYANIFSQLSFGASPDSKKAIDEFNKAQTAAKNNQKFVAKEIYVANPKGLMTHPETNVTLKPKTLGGPEIVTEGNKDYRAAMFEWLRAPENPFFSRSFVNRVWGHYFGIGIVHPVDDFSQANPPSNPGLLDALAKEFAEKKYDLRHIERVILNSRTYQLSALPNKTNELDRDNFSHSFVRPMMAEVVVDALNTALGVSENFGTDAPPNCRAIEVGSSRVQNATVAQIFRIFGRPSRTSACDCDRALEPALPQTLFRMTDQSILSKLSSGNGRAQTLLKSKKSDDEIVEELFLATLTRFPTDKEKLAFKTYLERKKDRQTAVTDTLWALINTREFILNH